MGKYETEKLLEQLHADIRSAGWELAGIVMRVRQIHDVIDELLEGADLVHGDAD